MTTAHRPTFDPARGREALRGPAYHQRLLPAHTELKYRQPGQGDDAYGVVRDLRADLEAAEAAHYAKLHGGPILKLDDGNRNSPHHQNDGKTTDAAGKRPLELSAPPEANDGEESPEAKRRRILLETRDIDADDDDMDDDDDSDSDSEDEEAELQRELERVRRERAEKRAREEAEKAAADAEAREREIALGNPLLNKNDFDIKRRWNDDVVFKNQARGTEEKGKKKEFVNDLLRSDFHRRFMSKYVR